MTDNNESKRHRVSFEAFDFSVTLRLQLRHDLEVAVVHAEIESATRSWDDAIPETDVEYAGFKPIRTSLHGLIADVITHSPWNHSLDCPYCKQDLELKSVTAGSLFEAIDAALLQADRQSGESSGQQPLSEPSTRTGSDSSAQDAEIYFYVLMLRANEPYPDFLKKKRERTLRLLNAMSGSLSEEEQMQGLSPKALEDVWHQSQINLALSAEPETIPMGPVGDKWNGIQAFEKQNHLDEYDAPWYLLLGSARSGKTALLSSPDMAFHCVTADGLEKEASYVVNAWYRSDSEREDPETNGHSPTPQKAMMLDIPSRYIGAGATSSDKAQWQHLLSLLRTHRRKAPVNGVVLTVSVDDLLKNEETRDNIARQLNRALQQVYQSLGCRFPVYVLITKADHIYGLEPFSRALSVAQSKAPFGWSNPNGLTGFVSEDYHAGFDELLVRVASLRPYLLPGVANPTANLPADPAFLGRLQADTLAAFGLEKELGALKAPLDDFLKRLFVQYGKEPVALFRGFYFTSIQQKGEALSVVYNTHQPFETVPVRPQPRNPEIVEGQEQLFIRDLFSQKILAEKGTLKRTLDPPDPEQVIRPNSTLGKMLRAALVIGLLAGLILLILQIIHLENILTVETDYGEFAWLPPGEYIMGSPATDKMRYEDEEQPHIVKLTLPMYMAKTELSQKHWSHIFPDPADNPSAYPGIAFPVDSVTWEQAQGFIDTINGRTQAAWRLQAKQEGIDDAQIDNKYMVLYDTWRLPTESEWEYAARAGTDSVLPLDLDARTWYSATSEMTTHPVAEKSFNEWGLYDMNGNVPEWTFDWFRLDYPGSVAVDPVARLQHESLERVLRGGAFYDQIRPIRPANRDAALPYSADKYAGFRLVYQPYPLPYDLLEIPKIKLYFKLKEWYRTHYKEIAKATGDLITAGLEASGLGADEAEAIGSAVEGDISGEEAPAGEGEEKAPVDDGSGGS